MNRAGGIRFSARVLGLSLAVCVVVAGFVGGGAAAAGTGSISGRVLSATDGEPVPDICVALEPGAQTVTGADGAYAFADLDPGTYTVEFTDCTPTPRYLSQWYLGADSKSSATPVEVADGADTPLADVSLVEGVVVSGTVTGGGAPLPGASVEVSSTGAGVGANVTTDVDGQYATQPLPTGSYRVRFSGGAAPGTWAPQFWDGEVSWNTADILELSAADVPARTGVDANLTAAAQIRGTVTNAEGAPLGGICANANVPHNGSWDWVNGATTQPDGTYVINSLPSTGLLVQFSDCSGGDYIDQWYQNATSPETAATVMLTPGEDRDGVDAQLTTGVAVAGRVTDQGGTPLSGISVSVNPVGTGQGGWAQTDVDGNYRTNGLVPGDYRVQFYVPGPNPAWATQYWQDQPSWNSAQILHLDAGDAPTRAGIDAVMAAAATIRGTVRAEDSAPIGNICVNAIVDTPMGPDWVGGATTQPDGSYSLSGLPAESTKVSFQDCNHVGPYIEQWWDNQANYPSATPLVLTAGSVTEGVDATLQRAGAISGRVTDRLGNPLSGICAQATTDDAFGGLATTDGSGDYTITLVSAGAFRVQFVDCNESPSYRAQWWDDQPTAATAALVSVNPGASVGNIDAQLDTGGPAAISGRVSTLRGAVPTTACVLAYLPNQYAKFSPVAADGTYTITGVPSGTFALAALACEGEEPSPVIPDPSVAGVAYRGLWWNQVPLNFDQTSQGGPDPIAQHANLVTLAPGDSLTDRDFCLGCGALALDEVKPSGTSVVLSFDAPGLVDPELLTQDVAANAMAAAIYTATCESPAGTQSASATAQTVVVTDLTPGATYDCVVTASVDGVLVASSNASAPFTVLANDAVDPAGASPALAFTGGTPGLMAALGAGLVAIGAVFLVATRRRRTALGLSRGI